MKLRGVFSAVPQQSLAAENLLCSFPAPRRSAAKPRLRLPADPCIGRAKSGQRRHRCRQRRPGSPPREKEAGRRASQPRFPPPREVSTGGSPLSLLFQEKGAGEEGEKLVEDLGKVAIGQRCELRRGAEELRGAVE